MTMRTQLLHNATILVGGAIANSGKSDNPGPYDNESPKLSGLIIAAAGIAICVPSFLIKPRPHFMDGIEAYDSLYD